MHEHVLHDILHQLTHTAHDAGRPVPRLLAVSKTRDETAVANLALKGQTAFGENYVQEALAKQNAMAGTAAAGLALEWHLIGHLQSNKAAEAATRFDWVQTVDRLKLVTALARHRRADQAALNVLIQVNIDDEASKHGCRPDEVEALATAIAAESRLCLRGLMVIPAPHDEPELLRPAFRRSKQLFDSLTQTHRSVDTLSMGMSDDYAVAIAEGSTMVRIGTALFGARAKPQS
ncbi:YggS family pyridoxal phosphate-dependent enzyme [Lysobacter antibioticus]|uniref:Pyridoxal phosphate homeostasis protein n=1 Tax=Lysobacter antibioticus TaxID=84531 RepID=A0A0S2F8A4_LYSAN|nr:YggS family pyridoxal phosphate-dependent enzyme [Lysobacter antibioticus]ALN79699.1 alanine racemase, N-terminal domain protein [Lysobacter antibioticus]